MPHHQHVLVTDPRSPTARPGTTISGSTRQRLGEPDSAHDERHGPGSECGPGGPSPLGAYRADGGTNFSVWSRTAAQLDLLLFDDVDDARPSRTIPLDPLWNKTSYFWHVLMPDVEPGQVYAWRVHGAFDPAAGLRHDASACSLILTASR